MEEFDKKMEQLKNGEIKFLEISKDEFLNFREFLVKREDFKYFSGNAMQGGKIVYTYLENPRS